MLTARLQWVRIEEATAIERYATNQTIVEAALQYIIIFRFAMEQELTIVDIYITYSSTSFAISAHVRQLIVFAKGFAMRGCTDTAGDI